MFSKNWKRKLTIRILQIHDSSLIFTRFFYLCEDTLEETEYNRLQKLETFRLKKTVPLWNWKLLHQN